MISYSTSMDFCNVRPESDQHYFNSLVIRDGVTYTKIGARQRLKEH